MQKLTLLAVVVLLTLFVLLANANDHTKHHKRVADKTPAKALILYVSYQNLTNSGVSPKVKTIRVCNNGSLSVWRNLKFTETVGEHYCWFLHSPLAPSVRVQAGAPTVVRSGSKYKWDIGQIKEYFLCTNTLRNQETTVRTTINARSVCTVQIAQFASSVSNVAWKGSVLMTFTDGSSSTSSTSGSYSGAFVSSYTISPNCQRVKSCVGVGADVEVVGDDGDDDDDTSNDNTTTDDDGDDDDEEKDFISFDLPHNEPKNELLQTTQVIDDAVTA